MQPSAYKVPEVELAINDDFDQGDDEPGSDEDLVDTDSSFCQRLVHVVFNRNYLMVTLSITFLYYIITGLQYWMSDYMIVVLKQEDTIVFLSFGLISITGPVFGVIVGGNITTALGGYSTRRSLQQTMCFTFMCLLSALPCPFIESFGLFCACLWFLLFFGGAILPSLTGILLNTVKKKQKTVANSIAYLAYNLFGFLPSPFIYGMITDSGEGKRDRLAMTFLMGTAIIPVFAFSIASYFIFRDDVLGFKAAEARAIRNNNKK